jgi:hypothetical protein
MLSIKVESYLQCVYKSNVGLLKEYNLRQHFETKHPDLNQKFSEELRKRSKFFVSH